MKSIYLASALFLSEFVSADTIAPVTDKVYFDVSIDGVD